MLTVVCRWHAQMLVSCCVRDVIGEKNMKLKRSSVQFVCLPGARPNKNSTARSRKIRASCSSDERRIWQNVARYASTKNTVSTKSLWRWRWRNAHQRTTMSRDSRRKCSTALFPVSACAWVSGSVSTRRGIRRRACRSTLRRPAVSKAREHLQNSQHTVCHVTNEPGPTKSEE